MGFGFLAVVIAYFPVLYQSFSRREVRLTLLDAWAGSPPAAAEILRRLSEAGDVKALDQFLRKGQAARGRLPKVFSPARGRGPPRDRGHRCASPSRCHPWV